MEPLCTGVAAPLKKCPFCGKRVIGKVIPHTTYDDAYFSVHVVCESCKIEISMASSYCRLNGGLSFDELISLMCNVANKWNTREKE